MVPTPKEADEEFDYSNVKVVMFDEGAGESVAPLKDAKNEVENDEAEVQKVIEEGQQAQTNTPAKGTPEFSMEPTSEEGLNHVIDPERKLGANGEGLKYVVMNDDLDQFDVEDEEEEEVADDGLSKEYKQYIQHLTGVNNHKSHS